MHGIGTIVCFYQVIACVISLRPDTGKPLIAEKSILPENAYTSMEPNQDGRDDIPVNDEPSEDHQSACTCRKEVELLWNLIEHERLQRQDMQTAMEIMVTEIYQTKFIVRQLHENNATRK